MLMDVSSAAPGCSAQFCSAGFLASQMALASDDAGVIYALWNSGSAAAGRSAFIFLLPQTRGKAGPQRRTLQTAAAGVEHCFPAITAGTAGDVRIAWMDTREVDAQNHPLWNTFYRASTNGGATWSPESQLSGPVRGYDYILPNGFLLPLRQLLFHRHR